MMASDPAIFDAMLRSLAIKMAIVKVLEKANNRQINALASERPAASLPDFRPAFDLFISRSPRNIVNDLLKKSEPTMEKAVVSDPENLKDVTKVMEPAMMRHRKAFTADRTVVSLKYAP